MVMVACVYSSELRQLYYREFKTILGYVVSFRPAWISSETLSQKQTKKSHEITMPQFFTNGPPCSPPQLILLVTFQLLRTHAVIYFLLKERRLYLYSSFLKCCALLWLLGSRRKFLRRSLATHYYMVTLVAGIIEVSLRRSQMRSYEIFSFQNIASKVGRILVKLLNLHYLKAGHSYRKGKSWYIRVLIYLGCLTVPPYWRRVGH